MKTTIKSQRQLRVAEQIKHLISEVIMLGDFKNSKTSSIKSNSKMLFSFFLPIAFSCLMYLQVSEKVVYGLLYLAR